MSKAVPAPTGTELALDPAGPKLEEVHNQLRSILASPSFHGSKRCQQFLEYVCEKALSGQAHTLKERALAVDVFGRPPESDLSADTIVRVGAREVRKRLAQYYVTQEGTEAAVVIDLLPGTYIPEFRYAEVKGAAGEQSSEREAASGHRGRPAVWLAGLFLLLLALIAVAVFAVPKWNTTEQAAPAFELFWEPAFETPEPVLLAVAHPTVYHLSLRAHRLSEERLPQLLLPMQRPVQLAPHEIDGSDVVPVLDQYVGFGDMVAATHVSAMLGQRSKEVRLRMASGLQFADLRQSPTFLIGAITNRWTMEIGKTWRFQFGRESKTRENFIVDTAGTAGTDPASTEGPRRWVVPAREDGSAPEDYVLICRIPNAATGAFLVVAAGVKQFGTHAAGSLLTDPAQLGPVLDQLPAGWNEKNLQLVLHVKVIGNAPAQPELAAWHIW